MMKELLLLLLTALLVPTGFSGEAVRQTDPSVLRYQTVTELDPETNLQRTTLDSQGYDLEVYFEVPVFPEDTVGGQEINDFFQDLNDAFFTPENENLQSIWSCITNPNNNHIPYYYNRKAVVNTQTEDLVSVTIAYDWYAGGVMDYGSDSYTFRAGTGELLRLTDLVDGTEEEIRAMIEAALKEQDAGENVINTELAWTRDLNEFEFYVEDGHIYLPFDKYEAAFGAYGGFAIELPAKWKEI